MIAERNGPDRRVEILPIEDGQMWMLETLERTMNKICGPINDMPQARGRELTHLAQIFGMKRRWYEWFFDGLFRKRAKKAMYE